MIYRWKDGARISISAPKAGKALVKLKNKQGLVIDDDVVEAARDPKSVFHDHFEWDDAICGEVHRREQAQHLIRCLVVRGKADEAPKQTFFGIRRKEGTEYFHRVAVLRSKQLADDLMAQAKRDMQRFVARYDEIKGDLEGVFGAIEQALEAA